HVAEEFAVLYSTSPDFRANVNDAVDTGLSIAERRYDSSVPFTPGRQYSRKDASRLLNWSTNMYSTIYGYRVDAETRSCPIFVTLHKSDEVSATTAYEDELIDTRTFSWYTRSKRTLDSSEVRSIVDNSVD